MVTTSPTELAARRHGLWLISLGCGLLFTSLYPIATFEFTGAPLVLFGRDFSSHGF